MKNFVDNVKNRVSILDGTKFGSKDPFNTYPGSIGGKIVFFPIEFNTGYDIKNEFFEPINSPKRYVEQRSTSLRVFKNLKIVVGQFIGKDGNVKDFQSLISEKQEIEKILQGEISKNGAFQMVHPLEGDVLVAVDGEINYVVDRAINQVVFTVTLKEVSGKVIDTLINAKTPDQTERKAKGVFDKIKTFATTGLNYAQASVDEVNNSVNCIRQFTGSLNKVTNQISNMQNTILDLPNVISNLAVSIKSFGNTALNITNLPNLFADKLMGVFDIFASTSGGESEISKQLLNSKTVNVNNKNDFLFTGTPREKNNVLTMNTVYQASILTIAFKSIPKIIFNNLDELNVFENKIVSIYNDLILRRVFLGYDKYQDPIYYYKEDITQNEINMLDSIKDLATLSLLILQDQKQVIQNTIPLHVSIPINSLKLTYLLYGSLNNYYFTIQNNKIKNVFSIQGTLNLKNE